MCVCERAQGVVVSTVDIECSGSGCGWSVGVPTVGVLMCFVRTVLSAPLRVNVCVCQLFGHYEGGSSRFSIHFSCENDADRADDSHTSSRRVRAASPCGRGIYSCLKWR